ncbi:MAG: hypothetical protein QME77_04185 [bacterium]|nr:hypothetical protein [bacterium]
MPTWNEFAWAGFLYGSLGGDRQYQALMRNAIFVGALRTTPNGVIDADVQRYLLKGYLNAWKTRVKNSQQSASAIKGSINNMLPWLSALARLSIKTVLLQNTLVVNGQQCTVADAVESCYRMLRTTGHRIGATATGKILHILNPELFVMWDKPILAHFTSTNGIGDSPQGYRAFLQQMNQDAAAVQQSFSTATLTPPAQAGCTPEAYLSQHMNYNPAKTMAKFLDEFYWVTVTNGVTVLPGWHP